jgi:hypothetical protein
VDVNNVERTLSVDLELLLVQVVLMEKFLWPVQQRLMAAKVNLKGAFKKKLFTLRL